MRCSSKSKLGVSAAALLGSLHVGCGDLATDIGQSGTAVRTESDVTAPAADPQSFTPAAAAARSGRLAGAAVAYGPLIGESIYRDVLAHEFNYVTPENATKWGPLQPSLPGMWDFAQADVIVDTALAGGQQVKGHALVWHSQLPSFITGELNRDELNAYMTEHIVTTMRHYRGRVGAWDVVNEAIADDGSGLRDTILARTLGKQFIDHAFRVARAHAQGAKLYYNDYGIETINPKSNAVYELVRDLVDRKVPIDGVGFQAHFDASSAPGVADMTANFRRFTELGLSVNVSELDVRVASVSGSRARKLAVQKQVYQRVAAACVATPGCDAVTSWGFTDKHSWVDGFFGADDPLQLDEQYSKKPAYFGMVDGFVGVPLDAPDLSPNLIGNSSLEAGLDYWSTQGPALLEVVTDRAHTGLRSAVATSRSASWQGPRHDITSLVASGRGYDVSVWTGLGGVSSAQLALTAQIQCSGGTAEFRRLSQGNAGDTGWVQLSGEVRLPSCPLQSVAVYVEGPAAGVDIYVDDLAVREKPLELGPNLVSNPGFESGNANGWFAFGSQAVSATTLQAHTGAWSAVATGRSASWNGIATNLLGLVSPGATYQSTAWARLGGASSDQLGLTAKITCSGGTSEFRRLASATGSNGQWVMLSGPLVVPACTLSELTLYVEGPQPGVDIYLDDVSVQQQLLGLGNNIVSNTDFETGTSGWFGWGGVSFSATTAQAHGGARSALISGRTASWNGLATNLLGRATPGKSYATSAWARLGSGSSTTMLSVKSRCSGATDSFRNVASQTANSSGWVLLTGTLNVPNCSLAELTLYVEGPPAGTDIYLDDVVAREQL
jgi:endo-1,4-beta-xylanase